MVIKMTTVLNKESYEKLIDEDIEWLKVNTAMTLEQRHIINCLEWLKLNKQKIDREERISEIASDLIPSHKPYGAALDAVNEAKKETAKAIFTCVLHVDEEGKEKPWFIHCGDMMWQVNWALDLSKAELFGWNDCCE